MSEKTTKAEVIPFSVDSKSAWHSVLKYLAQKEDTPVDIACGSCLVSSERMYYPVERLTINYEAQWNATSIFMRYWTETRTWLAQEVHYFDRWGREHNKPGFDYYDSKKGKWKTGTFNPIESRVRGYSGSASARPWDPREVTVQKAEDVPCEEETGRRNSSGTVKDSILNVLSERYPFFEKLYGSYNNGERNAYSDEAVRGTAVGKVVLADGEKKKELVAKAGNVAQEKCIQQIPGQKYANFSMGFKHEIDSAVWYYPAYKVVYKYQDKQYECLVSGCVVGCVYETAAPADDFLNTISQQSETRKKELNQSKKKATKQILIAGVVVELIAILGIFYNLVKITAGEGGKVGVIVWLVIAVSAIVFSRIMFAKRRRIKSDILNVDNEKETTVQNRQDRKMKIFDIMADDNLTDIEKEKKCKEV